VFAQRGYDQTSMPELADALGLGTGSLYHYFPGKEQLLIAICDQLMEPLLARVAGLDAEAPDPAERLRVLGRLWVAHVVEHRDHMLVFQQERHVIEHGAQWKSVRTSRKRFDRLLEDLLGEAGVADPQLAHWALLGMVNHTAQWFRPRGPRTPEEIADGYVDLVLTPASRASRR
jgi:AcrR family transcriptional regulator